MSEHTEPGDRMLELVDVADFGDRMSSSALRLLLLFVLPDFRVSKSASVKILGSDLIGGTFDSGAVEQLDFTGGNETQPDVVPPGSEVSIIRLLSGFLSDRGFSSISSRAETDIIDTSFQTFKPIPVQTSCLGHHRVALDP